MMMTDQRLDEIEAKLSYVTSWEVMVRLGRELIDEVRRLRADLLVANQLVQVSLRTTDTRCLASCGCDEDDGKTFTVPPPTECLLPADLAKHIDQHDESVPEFG